jgi:hypothetical protein
LLVTRVQQEILIAQAERERLDRILTVVVTNQEQSFQPCVPLLCRGKKNHWTAAESGGRLPSYAYMVSFAPMHEDLARPDYMVMMPPERSLPLYHLTARTDRARVEDFGSRAHRKRNRLWPDEDAADYFAISCYDDLSVARQNAMAGNWRGIAMFEVDGHQGLVYAQTYETHHYSVWGEPEQLVALVTLVEPV